MPSGHWVTIPVILDSTSLRGWQKSVTPTVLDVRGLLSSINFVLDIAAETAATAQ